MTRIGVPRLTPRRFALHLLDRRCAVDEAGVGCDGGPFSIDCVGRCRFCFTNMPRRLSTRLFVDVDVDSFRESDDW